MRRVNVVSLGLVFVVAACSGSAGPEGAAGAAGKNGAMGTMGVAGTSGTAGTGTASISGIAPAFAFQDRTVNVSISGSGTTWDSKTTVAFANTKVTVNSVTVASASGLVASITIAGDATLGATDVTVTDGASVTVYKGAFQIMAPLTVTVTPATGVPQGGIANLHVQMNDLTTPIDPDTFVVTLSNQKLATSTPSPTDYAFDLEVEADVLTPTGTFDLTVTFGGAPTITSLAPQSFKVAPRTATTLTTTAATGTLQTPIDTELYEYTPPSVSQLFVQFTTASMAGSLSTTVIPSTGLYADAVATFAIRYGHGTTSVDPFYVVVGDSNGLFGAGPTPADTSVIAFESPCTAATEITETAASNDDTYKTAQAVTTLPALVDGTLRYGAVVLTDVDVYAITVPAGATSIHASTGGDPADDTLLMILDSTGATVATSDDMDFQEDLVFPVTSSGTYYVAVSPSSSGNFSASDNTYQLFIAVK